MTNAQGINSAAMRPLVDCYMQSNYLTVMVLVKCHAHGQWTERHDNTMSTPGQSDDARCVYVATHANSLSSLAAVCCQGLYLALE